MPRAGRLLGNHDASGFLRYPLRVVGTASIESVREQTGVGAVSTGDPDARNAPRFSAAKDELPAVG